MEQEAARAWEANQAQATKTEDWMRILGCHHSVGTALALPHMYVNASLSHETINSSPIVRSLCHDHVFPETRLLGFAMLREILSAGSFFSLDEVSLRYEWENRPAWVRGLILEKRKKAHA